MKLSHLAGGPSLIKIASVAAALFLFAGCATMPPPSSSSKPAGSAGNERAIRSYLEGGMFQPGPWPEEKWWETFSDPNLSQAVEKALEGSPEARLAGITERLAASAAGIAGARLGATATFDTDITGHRISENSWLPAELIDNPYYAVQAGVALGYSPDLWGRNSERLKQAIGEEKAARASAAAARLSIAAAVAAAYLRLQGLEEMAGIAKKGVAARKESLKMIGQRADQGLSTALDVKRAELGLAMEEEALASLELNVALERNRLTALTGAGPDESLEISPAGENSVLPQAQIPGNLPLDLVSRRPDIWASLWRVDASVRAVGAAKADFYPNLNLRALAGLQSVDIGKLFSGGSAIVSVGPALHLPIFDSGALKARLEGAYAGYDLAVERYNMNVILAARQVADALARIENSAKRIRIARQAGKISANIYELTAARFAQGLDDYLEVLRAMDAMFSQSRNMARLRQEEAIARVELFAALGGGFDGKMSKETKEDERE